VSTDHVVFGYDPTATERTVNVEWAERRLLTLRLAERFLALLPSERTFEAIGAAQGWSPGSYASSVAALQDMGYRRIALGGMVPLKTPQILACLQAIDAVRKPGVELHLLGITRTDSMANFGAHGVTSFDSTSAFRQAFMDDRNNYHTVDDRYVALRVPQVDGNPALKRAILAGQVSQREALAAERNTLRTLRSFEGSPKQVKACLDALGEYETICRAKKSYLEGYERTLRAVPWRSCRCALCRRHGIEIAIFRGTERNKRRGFHNVSVLAEKMARLQTTAERSSRG
jgi:hypothetical protein